jgi:FtsZ-binding cell division protein ZapB
MKTKIIIGITVIALLLAMCVWILKDKNNRLEEEVYQYHQAIPDSVVVIERDTIYKLSRT